MKPTTIFITYNPKAISEQTLAVRLHSIGAVNGFRMYLPERYNSDTILDFETKTRIDVADYVVMFATTPKLSDTVKEEIEYAFTKFQDKSRIIVIYSTKKNLTGQVTNHFTEIYYNIQTEKMDDVIEKILNTVSVKQESLQKIELQQQIIQSQKAKLKQQEEEKEAKNALIAFLGIGLGLAFLASISKK